MSMTKEVVRDTMKDQNLVVLNVLPAKEYLKLHIKGSQSLPLGPDEDDFIREAEKRYGKDRFLITYCADRTCHAGPNAATILLRNGFRANDYPGGMKEWADAGYPVEGTEVAEEQASK